MKIKKNPLALEKYERLLNLISFEFLVCRWIFFSSSTCFVYLVYIHMIITGPQTAHHYIDSNGRSIERSIDENYRLKIFNILLLSLLSILEATMTTDKRVQLY